VASWFETREDALLTVSDLILRSPPQAGVSKDESVRLSAARIFSPTTRNTSGNPKIVSMRLSIGPVARPRLIAWSLFRGALAEAPASAAIGYHRDPKEGDAPPMVAKIFVQLQPPLA